MWYLVLPDLAQPGLLLLWKKEIKEKFGIDYAWFGLSL